MTHRLVHLTAIAKTHFNFGGMHIHIHTGGVDLDIQGIHRLTVTMQHIFIRAACGMHDHFVSYKATVHIRELMVCARTRGVRYACTSQHGYMTGLVMHSYRVSQKIVPQHIGQAAVEGGLACLVSAVMRLRAPLLDQFAFMPNGKAHFGPGEGVATHGFDAMRQFGVVGFQKLATCRRAVKQLFDFNRGALRTRGGLQFAAAAVEQHGGVLCGCAREHREFRHRMNRGQSFAPKAHGANRFKFTQAVDFAGRMALQGNGQLSCRNANAVVFYADQTHTACEQTHGDIGGTRVKRVVHQLAHH